MVSLPFPKVVEEVVLAAQAGAFINGHNLVVDGGTTIGDGS